MPIPRKKQTNFVRHPLFKQRQATTSKKKAPLQPIKGQSGTAQYREIAEAVAKQERQRFLQQRGLAKDRRARQEARPTPAEPPPEQLTRLIERDALARRLSSERRLKLKLTPADSLRLAQKKRH
jgi:hypothetical protein